MVAGREANRTGQGFREIRNGKYTMELVSQLAKKAVELEPVERIRVVEAILHSLDRPNHDIEQSWVAESEARYEAFKRGELDAGDWEEIKKRYRR